MTMPVTPTDSAPVPIGGAAPASRTAPTNGTASLLQPTVFLNLLVDELRYQDPMNPTSSADFMNQIAQLSQVEQLQSVSTASQISEAANLVGKSVTGNDTSGNLISGTVTGVTNGANGPTLDVNGTIMNLTVHHPDRDRLVLADDLTSSLTRLDSRSNRTNQQPISRPSTNRAIRKIGTNYVHELSRSSCFGYRRHANRYQHDWQRHRQLANRWIRVADGRVLRPADRATPASRRPHRHHTGQHEPVGHRCGRRGVGNPHNFTPGTVTQTGIASNVAIEGNGFLVVNQSGNTYYTLNGDLQVDANGHLATNSGGLIQGWAPGQPTSSPTTRAQHRGRLHRAGHSRPRTSRWGGTSLQPDEGR